MAQPLVVSYRLFVVVNGHENFEGPLQDDKKRSDYETTRQLTTDYEKIVTSDEAGDVMSDR